MFFYNRKRCCTFSNIYRFRIQWYFIIEARHLFPCQMNWFSPVQPTHPSPCGRGAAASGRRSEHRRCPGPDTRHLWSSSVRASSGGDTRPPPGHRTAPGRTAGPRGSAPRRPSSAATEVTGQLTDQPTSWVTGQMAGQVSGLDMRHWKGQVKYQPIMGYEVYLLQQTLHSSTVAITCHLSFI